MRIALNTVEKDFGKTKVLRGVTAQIAAGERVALIGPNGSGKSTLIRSLLGLLECDGEVLLDGRSPYEDREDLARRLAYVPQVAPQLSASVDEVLAIISDTRQLPRERVAEVARQFALELGPIAARPFRALSGGMKQKLLLSIALASAPELLVLDEPTASLDAQARATFFALCGQLPPKTTLVLCSHRLEELEQLVTRVIALEDGKVRYDGPAHEAAEAGGRTMVQLLLEAQKRAEEGARG